MKLKTLFYLYYWPFINDKALKVKNFFSGVGRRLMGVLIEQSGSSPYLDTRCENIFKHIYK